jgi:hypothetical protein
MSNLLKMLHEEAPFDYFVKKDNMSVEINLCDGHYLKLNKNGTWSYIESNQKQPQNNVDVLD